MSGTAAGACIALTNATVFTGDAMREGMTVVCRDGCIVAVTEECELPAGAVRRDLGGGLLAPGFIDVQVNGGGGVLFNDAPSVAAIARMGIAHRRFGTTGFLPTLISDTPEIMAAAQRAVVEAIAAGVPGVLGLHLEGPVLNPARRGAHARRFLRDADAGLHALEPPPGGVLVVTLAPERVPLVLLRRLADRGIRLCAGHTAASYEELIAAAQSGLCGVTHLFNAMPPLHARAPGALGAALSCDSLWCSIIADGQHVHDANIALAHRMKPRGKLFLVTDAMPPVGAESTAFALQGRPVILAEGRLLDQDGRLAGSLLDMATGVRNCVRGLSIPLDEALRMASLYPAAFLGLADTYGRIAPGYRASMILFDHELRVQASWIDGMSDTDGMVGRAA